MQRKVEKREKRKISLYIVHI